MKVLIGILCIDRDHENIQKLYDTLPKKCDIVVITRKQDILTQNKFKKNNVRIIIIPDYIIAKTHNLEKIIQKSKIIFDVAIQNNYDYLFFVDSDIVLYDTILDDMLKHLIWTIFVV